MPPPRSPRLALYPALGLLAAIAAGCAKKPLPVVKAAPGEVEYAGCYEVQREGPVCYLGKNEVGRKLTVHPTRPADRFEIRGDGKILPAAGVPGPAGPVFHLTVPKGVTSLEVRSVDRRAERSWTLRIAEWPTIPGWIKAGWAATVDPEKRRSFDRQAFDREIDRCQDARIRSTALETRLQLEPKGEDRASVFQRAISECQRSGFIQGEIQHTAILVFELLEDHDFARARSTLRAMTLPVGAPLEASYKVAYSQGLLAKYIGDFRTALGAFEAAAELAEGMEMDDLRRPAQQEVANMFSQLGRFAEAEAAFSRLVEERGGAADPCARATLMINRGWTRYLARDAGDWTVGDPIEPFRAARNLYHDNTSCPGDVRREFNATTNLALALLQTNRTSDAVEVISEGARIVSHASPLAQMWWMDLLARVALKHGKAEEALRIYARLEGDARTTHSPQNEWRAAHGKATALAALGRLREAATSLAIAEDLVDLQLSRVPLVEGRETFSDQWSTGSRLYVEVLLRTGHPAQALEVARRARSRVLNKLAESARIESLTASQRRERDAWLGSYWKLRNELDRIADESWRQPADGSKAVEADTRQRLREAQQALDRVLSSQGDFSHSKVRPALRQPRAGEVLLAYFPLSAERQWIAFCDDGTRVETHEFSMPVGNLGSPASEAMLANNLLEPFKTQILGAHRVKILPYGILKAVDFQALPFGGGDNVLASERPVAYGLDIPDPMKGAPPATLRALIVADSHGDLPEAKREGLETEAALRNLRPRWTVDRLTGEAATATTVRELIRQGIDLLHYAGHADFSGRGGWESQIPLGRQSRLTLGDLLTLDRQPRWVVLSGCETGASDSSAQVESQGLAHAFLLGGSEAVVAATRKVDDRVARQLVVEMYRHLGATPDLAVLLQEAQMTLRKQRISRREWASFRVFEP